MWKKNVIKNKTNKKAKELEDKLFILNPLLQKTLLLFRKNTYDMAENLRFINLDTKDIFTMADSTYTLDIFKQFQEKQRKNINEKIQNYSKTCREIVRKGFEDSLNQLKTQNYIVATEEEMGGQKKNQNFFRLKESAYENLGFSDNMSYEKRSELRKECSKFLRFSYLVDFLAMESLSRIFLYSIQELEDKISKLVSSDMEIVVRDQSQKIIQAQIEPLFQVDVLPNFDYQIDASDITIEPLKEFCPAPFGQSKDEEFNFLYHVHYKQKRDPSEKKNPNEDSDEEEIVAKAPNEDKVYDRSIVKSITQIWLKISPSKEDFSRDLMKCIVDGLNAIQAFERWSRHDDMTRYVSVLEEWDDMVGDDWEHPEVRARPPSQPPQPLLVPCLSGFRAPVLRRCRRRPRH